MDFHSLPRRELQALCKKNKIPANMTNVAMADALKALQKVEGLDDTCGGAQQFKSPGKADAVPPNTSRRTTARRNASASVANGDEAEDVTTRRRPARGSSRYAEKEIDGVPLIEIIDTPAPTGRKQTRARTQQVPPPTPAATVGRSSRAGESEAEEEKGEAVPTAEVLGTPAPTGREQTRAKTQQQEPLPTPAATALTARRSSVRANKSRAVEAAAEEEKGEAIPTADILGTPVPTGRKQTRAKTQQQEPLPTPATTGLTARRSSARANKSRAVEDVAEEEKDEAVPTAEILCTPVPTGRKQTRANTQQQEPLPTPATTALTARRSSVRANKSRAVEAAADEEKAKAVSTVESPAVDESKGPSSEIVEVAADQTAVVVDATEECDGGNATAVVGDVLCEDEVNSSKMDSFVDYTDEDVAGGAEGDDDEISSDVQAGDVPVADEEPEAVEELCDAPAPEAVSLSENYSTDDLKEAADVLSVGGDEPLAVAVCVVPVPEFSAPEDYSAEIASEEAVTIDDLCGIGPVPEISDSVECSADDFKEVVPESNCTTVISPVIESLLQEEAATFEMGTPLKSPIQARDEPVEDEEPVAMEELFQAPALQPVEDEEPVAMEELFAAPAPELFDAPAPVPVEDEEPVVMEELFQAPALKPVEDEGPVAMEELFAAPVPELFAAPEPVLFAAPEPVLFAAPAPELFDAPASVPVEDEEAVAMLELFNAPAPELCVTENYSTADLEYDCPEIMPVVETVGVDVKACDVPVGGEQPVAMEVSDAPVTEVSAPEVNDAPVDELCGVPVPESADDLTEEPPQSNFTTVISPVAESSLQKADDLKEEGHEVNPVVETFGVAPEMATIDGPCDIPLPEISDSVECSADDLKEDHPQSNCTTVIYPVVESSQHKAVATFEMGTPVKSPLGCAAAAPSSRMKSGVKKEVARMENVIDDKENAGVVAFNIASREGMVGAENKTEKKKQQGPLTKAEIEAMSLRQLRKQLATLSISNTPAAAKIGSMGIDKVAVEGKKIEKKRSALAALNENCLMSPQKNC